MANTGFDNLEVKTDTLWESEIPIVHFDHRFKAKVCGKLGANGQLLWQQCGRMGMATMAGLKIRWIFVVYSWSK